MAEIKDTGTLRNDQPPQETTAAMPSPVASPAPQSDLSHTKVTGRFNQFTSGYWALTVPLLSARYIADGINSVLKPVLKKPGIPKWADKVWAPAVGTAMLGVTAFYSERTYEDMKRQFQEPLGWEFDKSPDKVGLRDMLRSQNTLVHDAVKNLRQRTIKRVAVHLPFFAHQVPSPFKDRPAEFQSHTRLASPSTAVNLGVGTNAMYLASDALDRKRTFFEELQSFIDLKLNHKDKVGEMATAQDLMNLYALHARNNRRVTPLPAMDTPEWDVNLKLFERMADLMNQTYGNKPKAGHADFTVPKLVYMLGMGVLKSDNLEKNLDYVEIANHHGIPAIRKVVESVKAGMDEKALLASFPETSGLHQETIDAGAPPAKSFAQDELRRNHAGAMPTTLLERAQRSEGLSPSPGV